jgi:hypothetical protein
VYCYDFVKDEVTCCTYTLAGRVFKQPTARENKFFEREVANLYKSSRAASHKKNQGFLTDDFKNLKIVWRKSII